MLCQARDSCVENRLPYQYRFHRRRTSCRRQKNNLRYTQTWLVELCSSGAHPTRQHRTGALRAVSASAGRAVEAGWASSTRVIELATLPPRGHTRGRWVARAALAKIVRLHDHEVRGGFHKTPLGARVQLGHVLSRRKRAGCGVESDSTEAQVVVAHGFRFG